MAKQYKPTWESLKTHPTAEWMRKAKFGIYTVWCEKSIWYQT
jgi:hypothetical protein